MVKKEEFFYKSADKKTKIRAVKWVPHGDIKGIIQIAHGMLEHIDRYDEFALYLAQRGFLVVGNDHLGHGYSLNSEEDRGYFSDEGNKVLLEDILKLLKIAKEQYSNIPYYILGHSMGSFLTRQFLCLHGDEVKGAIVVGTGHQPLWLLKFGILITKAIALFKGWRYRSLFVNSLAIGNNNKYFKPGRTSVDWLSRDEKVVDKYLADPKINFIFTVNGYYHMFKGMTQLYNKENLNKIPKDLPVIFMSGKEDPVGDFGKGATKALNSLKEVGMKNLSIKLYEDARHEILNELNKEEVFNDIVNWLNFEK